MRALLLALFALPALGAGALAENPPFRVVNRTGGEAVALNAVRTGRGDWGRNLLPEGRRLADQAAYGVRPSESAGCRFDIRLVLADGREARAQDVDICATRTVTLESAARPAPLQQAAPAAAAAPRAGGPARPGGPQAQINPNARNLSSGSGFVVARDRVLTNQHVIDGCNRVLVRTADGRWLAAVPPARVDGERDLALLAVPGDPGPPLTFRANPVRRGDGVVTYGFPLAGLLSSGPSLTTGEVSALAGLGDNPRQIQISAPVQPGNSGGPLLDRQGNVAGVVVSKLNAQRVAQRTGDIPQNVNFAVKGGEAVAFLRDAGAAPALAESRGAERSPAEIGDLAHRSTVFVRCER